MKKYTIVISFSGGRTSGYMLRRLLDEYPDATFHIVFANTGKEREETLVFVNECAERWGVTIHWIEANVHPEKGIGTGYTEVNFDAASRKGEPFLEVIKKYGIPGPFYPHCSRELKVVPIAKWVSDHVKEAYQMAIGIRYDEHDRLGDYWYPLNEWHVTKAVVRDFWRSQPFDLQLADYEGNCDLCFKKSTNKKLTIMEQHPEFIDWWESTEKAYGKGHVMNRMTTSYETLRKMAERGKFRRAVDQEVLERSQQTIFDLELKCQCGVPA